MNWMIDNIWWIQNLVSVGVKQKVIMQLDGGWRRTEAAMGFDTNLMQDF